LLSVTTVLVVFAFSASSAFASAPAPPTNASATATSGQAVVSFTAPTITGGLPIISYSVTASPGGAHASGTASPITVTGLTDGTSYTFTVTATNANAGTNTIYFQGRLSASRKLPPGIYTATVTAQATGSAIPAGATSLTVGTLRFTIAK
jgi:large repetitive protein